MRKERHTDQHGEAGVTKRLSASSSANSRRIRTGQRIEKAALELFVERGLDGVTAEEIARAAGVSRRTFFRYFPARADVLAAVHSRGLMRMFDLFQERPAHETLIEAIVSVSRVDLFVGEEAEIAESWRALTIQHPAAWQQVVAHLQPIIHRRYSEAVTFRLEAAAMDAAAAPVIAAASGRQVATCIFSGCRTDAATKSLTDCHMRSRQCVMRSVMRALKIVMSSIRLTLSEGGGRPPSALIPTQIEWSYSRRIA
jgi:AcrR family transcriptional regulator